MNKLAAIMRLAQSGGMGINLRVRLISGSTEGLMDLQKKPPHARILRLQIIAGVAGSVAFEVFGQTVYALSFLSGVMLMAANGWWLAIRLDRTEGLGVEAGQRSLYAGAVVRFVALLAGLLLAQVIGLHLLLIAAGMFIAQVVVFVSALVGFNRENKV